MWIRVTLLVVGVALCLPMLAPGLWAVLPFAIWGILHAYQQWSFTRQVRAEVEALTRHA